MKKDTTKQIAARLKLTADGSAAPPKPAKKPAAKPAAKKPAAGNRKFVNGKGWCVFKNGQGWVPEVKPGGSGPRKTSARKVAAAKGTDATDHPLAAAFNRVVATFEAKLGEPTEREKTPGFGSDEIMYTSATWDIRSNKGEKPIFNVTLDHKESHIIFTYASDMVKATASGTTAKEAANAFMGDLAESVHYAETKKRDVKADAENIRSLVGILKTIK